MTTDWKWRVIFFVRAQDNTPANRQAFAEIFANNSSGETAENEARLFDGATRFVTPQDNNTVVAFGLFTAVKAQMRDDIQVFLATLTQARYVVIANTTLPQYADGEFIQTNIAGLNPVGELFTWGEMLAYIESTFGLIPQVQIEV